MTELLDVIYPKQKQLYHELKEKFKENIVAQKKGAYLLVKGEAPVLLLAHLDTVHREAVKYVCFNGNGNILMSPQGIGGDDRCGVYSLCRLYELCETKPWLLFLCDEEIGGVGAATFAKDYSEHRMPNALKDMKMLIEIDRKGLREAVYYNCGNKEFEDFITSKGFVTNYGTFSDISEIAPEIGIAAVNLSAGYYNQHTQHEYIDIEHLNETLIRVQEIVQESMSEEVPQYKYVALARGYSTWKTYIPYDSYGNWDDFMEECEVCGKLCDWIDMRKVRDGFTTYTVCKECADELFDPNEELPPIDDKYVEQYNDLLQVYDQEELDSYIEEYGDAFIASLWSMEFSPAAMSHQSYSENNTVDW